MARPRPPTSADVARLAGVSRATVSAVINGTKPVSPATVERVAQAIATLDYQPDFNARGLKSSRTRTVGMLLPSITSPFWPPVVRAVDDHLRTAGCQLLLANTDENHYIANDAIESFLGSRVDGVIAAPPAGVRERPYFGFVENAHPLVFIERSMPGIRTDCVMVDDEEGGYMAAEHLIRLGHRKIAVIAMPLDIASSARRVAGIRRALVAHGLALADNMLAIGQFSDQAGYECMRLLLEVSSDAFAVIACSLRLTTGALALIRDRGLRVPEDVAIVGWDEMPWATLCTPQLTVVAQPAVELGHTAADLLLRQLEHHYAGLPLPEPRTVTFQPRLLVRHSCGATGEPAPRMLE
jgi:LacI family transcriptional regulator, galactose operon repressor